MRTLLFLFYTFSLSAQISGTIVNEKDEPIPYVNIWVQNIKGIEYFIDGSQNVYKHEDVINNSTNPRIIAKYSKSESGAFSIAFL